MSDMISRQAAIDALCSECQGRCVPCDNYPCGEVKAIEDLQSAQSDIIRCNACKHWTQTTGNMPGFGLGDCDYLNAKLVSCNGFCYWAERRTDGRD